MYGTWARLGTNPIRRDSFVRTDQSQTSLAGKYCEIRPMKNDFCKDFIRTGRGDRRAWYISHSTMIWSSQHPAAARRFCRAYSVTGLFYLKIYRQLTHTNAPAASSMHHAGVAVHPHYSVVGCGSSPCFQPVLTVVVVLKQPSLIIHTSRDLLQQSVLVDYCCFHLAFGASTALGSYIGHRNKRRLLSTLREEFVEKSTRCLI